MLKILCYFLFFILLIFFILFINIYFILFIKENTNGIQMKLLMINRYFYNLSIEKIINYAFNMFKQITPTLNMFLADLIIN